MASITPVSQSSFFKLGKSRKDRFNQILSLPISRFTEKKARMVVVSATSAMEKQKNRYPGEAKGFVEEMRFVAMKLHTRDQAREGEKEPEGPPVAKWEPTVEGYLKFLVDSKLVFESLERVVERAAFPECECCFSIVYMFDPSHFIIIFLTWWCL